MNWVKKHYHWDIRFAITWYFWALMYLFTSDTVEPMGKWEFYWRKIEFLAACWERGLFQNYRDSEGDSNDC